jgi:hypothetical protein
MSKDVAYSQDAWTRLAEIGSDTMPTRETMKAVAMSVGFGLVGFLFLVLVQWLRLFLVLAQWLRQCGL